MRGPRYPLDELSYRDLAVQFIVKLVFNGYYDRGELT